MKVLLINGSPRKQGNTNTALLEISRELSVHGIESEMVWIGTGHIRGCIACGKCKEKSEGRCIFNDDITNDVISKMAHCDALVVGSPVYYGQPSGQLLCLQQRMLFAGGKTLRQNRLLQWQYAVEAEQPQLIRRCLCLSK